MMKRLDKSQAEVDAQLAKIGAKGLHEEGSLALAEVERRVLLHFGDFDGAIAAYRAAAEDTTLENGRRVNAWVRLAFLADDREDASLFNEAISEVLARGTDTDAARLLADEWPEAVAKLARPDAGIPTEAPLLSAHPNPFNPVVTLQYRVDEPSEVSLVIYNAAGQRVRELVQSEMHGPGLHTASWNSEDDTGRRVASGVYLVRYTGPAGTVTERMTLVR